jgi:hypothetical protein
MDEEESRYGLWYRFVHRRHRFPHRVDREQGEEGSNEGNIFISELFRVRMHDGVAKASLRCVPPSLLASLLPYLPVAMTSWIAT